MQPEPIAPLTFVSENWLTRKPNEKAWLITFIATFLMFVSTLFYWNNWWNASHYLGAEFQDVFLKKEYWRAWSTLFIHADEKHLFGNSFLFVIFAYFLSGYFGKIVFPVAAIFFGGLVNFFVLKNMPSETILLGMSGVVYWMGGAWLTLYIFLETRKSYFQRILRASGLAFCLFMPAETFDPQVSYMSHGYGFLAGALFGVAYYFWSRKHFLEAQRFQVIEDEENFFN